MDLVLIWRKSTCFTYRHPPWHVLLSSPNSSPRGQPHWKESSTWKQSWLHPPLLTWQPAISAQGRKGRNDSDKNAEQIVVSLSIFHIPLQLSPSLSSTRPRSHSQRLEPLVFTHSSAHPPLSFSHSFTSTGNIETTVRSYHQVTLVWIHRAADVCSLSPEGNSFHFSRRTMTDVL